jgi:hypothetical protein
MAVVLYKGRSLGWMIICKSSEAYAYIVDAGAAKVFEQCRHAQDKVQPKYLARHARHSLEPAK